MTYILLGLTIGFIIGITTGYGICEAKINKAIRDFNKGVKHE